MGCKPKSGTGAWTACPAGPYPQILRSRLCTNVLNPRSSRELSELRRVHYCRNAGTCNAHARLSPIEPADAVYQRTAGISGTPYFHAIILESFSLSNGKQRPYPLETDKCVTEAFLLPGNTFDAVRRRHC